MAAVQRIGRTGEALASIDELIALIEADIGKSDSANASIEASRAEAEELAGQFAAMNVDGQAARTEQVQQALAEALAQGPAIRAKLEEAKARAEALKTRGSGGGRTVSAAPAPTPLTAAPQAIREPVAKVGDPVKPGPTAANPYRKELSSTEEGDKTKSALQRLGRVGVRNASDLKTQGEALAKASNQTIRAFDPPGDTVTEVGVSDHPPQLSSTSAAVAPNDLVGTGIVMASAVFEGATRLIRNRRRKT